MSKYPLIIEKGTNYAFVIDESKNLDFNKIREYSSEFYKMLPSKMQEKLYDEILHGACELDSEPKLNAYMFALGKMHNAKLQHAYDHLSENFLKEKQIDIIDYACGQGMGTICYADFLKRKHIKQNIRRIILIEPSEKALARASLHVSAMFPDAELITINKGFDDLTCDDLFPDKNVPMLHIISNVLDMATTYNSDGFFDLEDFANLISKTIDGKNEFVCVEPLFGYAPKDEKVDDFIDYVGIETYYEIEKGKGEFVNGKDWTCVIRVGMVYKNVKKNINISKCSFDELLKKAERGDASAQFELGIRYKKGQGVIQSYKKAVEWYKKSAEQGNAKAQNNLGVCYKNGEGVEQDYEKAAFWYRKSAEQGNEKAQDNLKIIEKIKRETTKINGHEYVDLGLPSGLKWATCNVGANSPEEYGDYYAWGETETKNEYTEDNCSTYGKEMSDISGNPKYDVARKKWGGEWRMPTYYEMEELESECDWIRRSQNGVDGYMVIGPNFNSIFIPAAGICCGTSIEDDGDNGYYLSSTPYVNGNYFAYVRYYKDDQIGFDYRYFGRSVRPVFCNDQSKTQIKKKTTQVDLKTILDEILREEFYKSGKSDTKINGHEYVDLGLSSRLLWATCNVGAESPEECGDYYAWGEIKTKSEYTEDNSLTYGKTLNDISGNPKYDVARKKWGGTWRMPRNHEMEELVRECSWEWKSQKGVDGCKVIGPNGNSIFMPAAGIRCGAPLGGAGNYGYYWNSDPDNDDEGAYYNYFTIDNTGAAPGYRYCGLSVRPVSVCCNERIKTQIKEKVSKTEVDFYVEKLGKSEKSQTKINGHEYVDLGLSSGLKWATCNVGANSPEEYGNYYAWGEIKSKKNYNKYNCINVDNLIKLAEHNEIEIDISGDEQYDIVRYSWGAQWRLPNDGDFLELLAECEFKWKMQKGKKGCEVIGPNGNSIFLPACGCYDGTTHELSGDFGYYWSSVLGENNDYELGGFYEDYTRSVCLCIGKEEWSRDVKCCNRYLGFCIRPVLE